MNINDNLNNFNIVKPEKIANPFKTEESKETQGIGTFSQLFNNVIGNVNNKLLEASEMSRKVASGEVKDINQVVFAWQEAGLLLKMTRGIAQKLIEGAKTLFQTNI